MKTTILFLFLLHAPYVFSRAENGQPLEDPRLEMAWLKVGIAAQLSRFQRVTFVTNPDDKAIVAVNCQIYEDWTGGFLVFHHTGDKIDWFAKLPKEYIGGGGGAYIMSCKWRHLDALNLTILEVFDSDHMGLGDLWLFTLEGQELRLLLDVPAVDRYHEHHSSGLPHVVSSTIFGGGKLDVDYPIPKVGKYEIVRLMGTVIELDDNDKVLSTKPYSATWTWDTKKRIFVPTKHWQPVE